MKTLVIYDRNGKEMLAVIYPNWSEESLNAEVKGCEKDGLNYSIHSGNIINLGTSKN